MRAIYLSFVDFCEKYKSVSDPIRIAMKKIPRYYIEDIIQFIIDGC
jgi:hypothetical protein